MATTEFDRDREHYVKRGNAVAFSMRLSSGIRLAYIDTTDHLPGMVELIEVDDGVRAGFTSMFRRSREWDGRTLIVGG